MPELTQTPQVPRCRKTGLPLEGEQWPEWARRRNERISREADRKRRLLMDKARIRGRRPNSIYHPAYMEWLKGDWEAVYRKLGRPMPDFSVDETLAGVRLTYANELDSLERGHAHAVAGYLYIITNEAFSDVIKVGTAIDPESRLNAFQTGDPERRYRLRYSRYTPERRRLEAEVHKELEEFHYSGEWFTCPFWIAQTVCDDLANDIESNLLPPF